jgi:hypothetical protein
MALRLFKQAYLLSLAGFVWILFSPVDKMRGLSLLANKAYYNITIF